MFYVNWIQ